MLGKIAFAVVGIVFALWWAGVDFDSARDGLTVSSHSGARRFTGGDDGGWG